MKSSRSLSVLFSVLIVLSFVLTPVEPLLARGGRGPVENSAARSIGSLFSSVLSFFDNTRAVAAVSSVTGGLVTYLDFDENSGSVARDNAGSNDGSVSGATWTSGKAGAALNFDGSNDFVDLGAANSLFPGNALTLSAWVKPNSIGSAGMIVGAYSGGSRPYQLRMQSGGAVRFALNLGSGETTITTSAVLTAGTWSHVVGVWDGSTMRVYVNGSQVGNSVSKSGSLPNNGIPVRVGRSAENNFPFNGVIDDVRIYSRALSANEVSTLHNAFTSSGSSGSTSGSDTQTPSTPAETQTQAQSVSVDANITLNPSNRFQTIIGLEGHVQTGMPECSTSQTIQNAIIDKAVNELGLTRVRLEVRSGDENDKDYEALYKNGQIDRDAYRLSWFSPVNDNSNPNSIDSSKFHFTRIDDHMQRTVLPLRQKLAAKGEKLYVNLNFVDFEPRTPGGNNPPRSAFEHYDNVEEYAELIEATFMHLNSKYGFVPDALEIILEPDNSEWGTKGTGTLIGQAAVAAKNRLAKHGWNPDIIAPSSTNAQNAWRYFDNMAKVPGFLQAVDEISYHLYGGATDTNIANIWSRAKQHGLSTSMLEWTTATEDTLYRDLTVGNVSAWQKFAIAYCAGEQVAVGASATGGNYYIIYKPQSNPVLEPTNYTGYFSQYFKYVRPGAVRIGASSDTSTFKPVAFINSNGNYAVVIDANSGGDFAINGLPAGTYGVTHATSRYKFQTPNADVSIASGQALVSNIPSAGIVTVFRKGSGTPPPPPPPSTGTPSVDVSVNPSTINAGGSSAITWSTQNVSSCSASGGWSGNLAISGRTGVSPTVTTDYTVTCSGSGGTASDTARVTVNTQTPGFEVGDRVETTTNLNVRSSAGSSGTVLGTQSTGSAGVITSGPTVVSGVDWWNVNYDSGADGWSSGEFLKDSTKTPPPPAPPSVDITASKTSITADEAIQLSWTSQNTSSCTASGDWSGSKPLSGNQAISPNVTSTFIITCLGGNTSTADSVTVTVVGTPVPPPPPPTSGTNLTPSALMPVVGPLIARIPGQNADIDNLDNYIIKNEKKTYDAWFLNKGTGTTANHYGALMSRLHWAIRNGEPYGPGVTDTSKYAYARGREIVRHYLISYSQGKGSAAPHNNTGLADIEALWRLEGAPIEAYNHIWGTASQNSVRPGSAHENYLCFNGQGDARMVAVAFQSLNAAHRLGIPYKPHPTTGHLASNMHGSWKGAGDYIFNCMKDDIQPDGTLHSPSHAGQCGSDPVCEAYIFNAWLGVEFLRWDKQVAPNPQMRAKGLALLNHLVDELGSLPCLPYLSGDSSCAPDLAGMMVEPAMMAYEETGDAKFYNFAKKHLAEADRAWTPIKQYNQTTSWGSQNFAAYEAGFSWKTGGGTTPPPPPPPAPPSVDITASKTSITADEAIQLSWTSQNTSSCTASGDWSGSKPLSGNQAISPNVTSTFIITCLGGNTSTADSVTVTVVGTPADTVAPTAPGGVSASAVSSSQINLSWNASSDNVGVVGYKVYRGNTEVGSTLAPATTYQDKGLAAGTAYTYAIAAFDAAGNTSSKSSSVSATTLPGTQQPPAGGGAYSPTSPHWRHARFAFTDYRTHYSNYNKQGAAGMALERKWNAEHFDYILGGNFDYKTLNPSILQWIYDINFWHHSVTDTPMPAWLRANGYNEENAFVHYKAGDQVPDMTDDTGKFIPAHTASGQKIKTDRITFKQFAGRDYWFANLSDPGFQAFRKARTQQLVASGMRDGIFFDVMQVSTMASNIKFPNIEYQSHSAYTSDYTPLVAAQRPLVPIKRNILNTAQYTNKAENIPNIVASGGVMCEFCNSAYRSQLYWDVIDDLVSQGVVVHYQSAQKTSRKNIPSNNATEGNYNSVKERALMFEYASYLMIVNPANMDLIFFDPYNEGWAQHPASDAWLTAYEYDIGLATGPRSVYKSGTDPLGQRYQVWKREFEKAIVLARPMAAGHLDNSDGSVVTVDLPAGTWYTLWADGTLGSAVTSTQLRSGEAMIFIRGTGSVPPPPPPPPTPTVNLSITPSSITAGGSVTLSWSSSNATSCSASGDWSGSKALSGSQTLAPTKNSTYILTCSGNGGTANDSAGVTVSAAPVPTVDLSASKTSITSGESITLSWGSQNTSSCSASGDWSGNKALSGSQNISPAKSGTYTITCTGNGKTVSDSVSITVNSVPPPAVPNVDINASASSITSGQSVTISWASQNATSCSASGDWSGSKALSGSQTLTPTKTSTYTITCVGGGTSTGDQVTVTVTPVNLPPTTDTQAPSVPSGIKGNALSGSQIEIAWNASSDNIGVTAYKIYRNNIEVGSTIFTVRKFTDSGLKPDTTYTYQVVAVDAAGNISAKSVSVSITTDDEGAGEVPNISFSASPDRIVRGELATLSWTADNADRCTASGGWRGRVGVSGSTGVDPTRDTTYVLTCSNSFGSDVESLRIQVNDVPDPEPTEPITSRFEIGDRVRTTANLNVRTGALGTRLGLQRIGSTGTIVAGPIVGEGVNWWNINYDRGVDGWSVETYLAEALDIVPFPPITIPQPIVEPIPVPFPTPTPVETPSQTTSISIGDNVAVFGSALNVRSTPILGAPRLGSQPIGARGEVVAGPIVANGYRWWRINYNGALDGWSVENYLRVITGSTQSASMPVEEPASTPSQSTSPSSSSEGTINFERGTAVVATSAVNVRREPSLSGVRIGTQSVGVAGEVLEGPRLSGGYIWWFVNFDGSLDGWVAGNFISPR